MNQQKTNLPNNINFTINKIKRGTIQNSSSFVLIFKVSVTGTPNDNSKIKLYMKRLREKSSD